jgi:hypothetical protein
MRLKKNETRNLKTPIALLLFLPSFFVRPSTNRFRRLRTAAAETIPTYEYSIASPMELSKVPNGTDGC